MVVVAMVSSAYGGNKVTLARVYLAYESYVIAVVLIVDAATTITTITTISLVTSGIYVIAHREILYAHRADCTVGSSRWLLPLRIA